MLVLYVSNCRHLLRRRCVRQETAFYVTDFAVQDIAEIGPIMHLLQDQVIHVNMVVRLKGLKGSVSLSSFVETLVLALFNPLTLILLSGRLKI